MALYPTRESDRPTPPPPTPAAGGVEVRRYESVGHFQSDAVVMAAAGWQPVTQSEVTGGFPVGPGITIAIGVFIAILVSLIFGALLVVIGALVGMVSRKKQLVVTYRYAPPAG